MKKLFLFNAMLLIATSVFATSAVSGLISKPASVGKSNLRCTAEYTLTVVDGDGNVLANYMAVASGSTCASAMHAAKGMAYVDAYTLLHS